MRSRFAPKLLQLHTFSAMALAVALGFVGLTVDPESASATVNYGDLSGSSFDFTNMAETTTSAGDAEPLWGAPSVAGNTLIFTPGAFTSTAGGGSVDQTNSTFVLDIISQNKDSVGIDALIVNELGDYALTGAGTNGTSASVLAGAGLVITEVNLGGSLVASAIPGFASDFVSFDTPTQGGEWTATINANIQAIVDSIYGVDQAFATAVSVVWDNNLSTTSESGTNALIQKKIGLPAVTMQVVPEPGTGLLFALGLAGLAFATRRASQY